MVKKGNVYAQGRDEIEERSDEVGRLISKYLYGKYIPRDEYFDLHQSCWLRVLEGTYDSSKGSLSNYVWLACRTTMFAYYRLNTSVARTKPTVAELEINTDISDINSIGTNTVERELNQQLLESLAEEFGGNGVDIMLECITKYGGDSSKLDARRMYLDYRVPRPEFDSIIKRLKENGAIK